MGRYRKVTNFNTLSFKKRQEWAQEFVDQAEQRMSPRRKRKYHRLVVRFVWARLKKGEPYVTENEVVVFIRGVANRKRRKRV